MPTFTVGGIKYIKKSKLSPKKQTAVVFSDFSLSGKQNPMNFDKKFLPPFFDIYNMYIINNTAFNEFSVIKKMIRLDDIIGAGYVDYTEDYLNGYNFYIQTYRKLYIMSCSLATNTVRWVESLKLLMEYGPSIIKKRAKHAFSDPTRIIKAFDNFDPRTFIIDHPNLFNIKSYKLNERFDRHAFEISFEQVKRLLRVLKFNESLSTFVQPFLVEYHTQICKSVANSSFEFSIADMSVIYKLIRRYSYVLEKYNIIDVYLAKFLVKFNNSLFEQLTSQILIDMKTDLTAYLSIAGRTDCTLSFYTIVFDSIEKYAKSDAKLKISHEFFTSIIKRVINLLLKQLIFNKDIHIQHITNIVTSAFSFSSLYHTFIKENKDKFLDGKFIENMDDDTAIVQNNRLINACLNEFENYFEKSIQSYFNCINDFTAIELQILLNNEICDTIKRIDTSIPIIYAEPLFNRVLNFLLTFYFSKSFLSVADPEYDHEFLNKLKKDQQLIRNTFAPFVDKENLFVLLAIFDHLYTLLTEVKYEILLRSIINFALFFSNRLTTEMLVAILAKNIDIPIDVEEELINYFNYCILVNSQKDPTINKAQSSKSTIAVNQCSKRHMCNYLPSISLSIADKIRRYVYRHRCNALMRKREESIDLSLDLDLVNTSANEKYLENIAKLAFFNEREFSTKTYTDAMKVK